jgi:hypothetical protein
VVQQTAVIEACYATGLNCEDVSGYPELVWSWFPDGASGRFYPEEEYSDQIWLTVNLRPHLIDWIQGKQTSWSAYAYAVVLHETVHWLDWHSGSMRWDENTTYEKKVEDVCQSERLAWSVENTWLINNGWKPMTNWMDSYEHCQ